MVYGKGSTGRFCTWKFFQCFMGKIQLEDSELGSFFNVLWERFNWKIRNLEVFLMFYGKDSTGRF